MLFGVWYEDVCGGVGVWCDVSEWWKMFECDGMRLRFLLIVCKVDDSMSRCAVGSVYCLWIIFLMFVNCIYCVCELVKFNYLIFDCCFEMVCVLRCCYVLWIVCWVCRCRRGVFYFWCAESFVCNLYIWIVFCVYYLFEIVGDWMCLLYFLLFLWW